MSKKDTETQRPVGGTDAAGIYKDGEAGRNTKAYGEELRRRLGGVDAAGMQFLIPGWTFDSKRPCLVR